MAFNLGFGSSPLGVMPGGGMNGSQLQDLLAQIQSQQAAGAQPSQLQQMQNITGVSPGGNAMGLPANSGGQMQGGPSAMPGNPGSMSPSPAVSWPGMNGPNGDPASTNWPGQGSPMAQLPGTVNPQLVSGGLGLLSALTSDSAKNKQQAEESPAQSRVLQAGQNAALQRLLSGYGSRVGGLMGAYGG